MERTLHITHNDADGVLCGVISKFMGFDEVELCSIGEASSVLREKLEPGLDSDSMDFYDKILVTDLDIEDEDVLKMLEKYREQHGTSIMMVDHHATNRHKHLDWVHVDVSVNDRPVSAAWLVWNKVDFRTFTYTERINEWPTMWVNSHTRHQYDVMDKLVDDVSDYDVWNWKKSPNPDRDPNLEYREDLMAVICKKTGFGTPLYSLMESMVNNLICGDDDVSIVDIFGASYRLYEEYYRGLRVALESVEKNHRFFPWREYFCSIFIDEGKEYTNDQATYIYETHPNVDIVIILAPDKKVVSFRSGKSDVNCGRLAKSMGGGGHPGAAGAMLPTSLFLEFMELYYTLCDEDSDIGDAFSRTESIDDRIRKIQFKDIMEMKRNIVPESISDRLKYVIDLPKLL